MTPSEFRKKKLHLSGSALAMAYNLHLRADGVFAELASGSHPRFIGIDYGKDGSTTECEVEALPDGTIKVLDIRETPPTY